MKTTATPGAGAVARQEDWTIEAITEEFLANEFKLSRRKTAFLVQAIERTIQKAWDHTLDEKIRWAPASITLGLKLPECQDNTERWLEAPWLECAAHVADLLSPLPEQSEMGYETRRREMCAALDAPTLATQRHKKRKMFATRVDSDTPEIIDSIAKEFGCLRINSSGEIVGSAGVLLDKIAQGHLTIIPTSPD